MVDGTPRMKGAMLAEFLRWHAEHRDATAVRWFVMYDPEARALGLDVDRVGFGVVPSVWYPAPFFHRLIEAGLGSLDEGERSQLIRESTDAVVEHMLRGLYAVLFALVASPDRYARHIQRAWNQLHDTGTREVRIVAPGEAESITRDWPGHHPILCEMVHETTRAVFSHMRVGQVSVTRERCVSRGARACVARVRWR